MMGINMKISLIRLTKGGAPPFLRRAININALTGGVSDIMPLLRAMVREVDDSYNVLTIENSIDLVTPWPRFISMIAVVAQCDFVIKAAAIRLICLTEA